VVGVFQVDVETVMSAMKKSIGLAKNIILEAIPRIAAVNWEPICQQYKVWIKTDSTMSTI